MFSHDLKDKTFFYARYVCLNDDGNFVRALWQLQTDRWDNVGSGNNQWIGRERSTHLVALWIKVTSIAELELGDEIQLAWDDALEFEPNLRKAPPAAKGQGKAKETFEHLPAGPKAQKT